MGAVLLRANNGQRVAESTLANGDRLQLGRTLMIYTAAQPSAAVLPAANGKAVKSSMNCVSGAL